MRIFEFEFTFIDYELKIFTCKEEFQAGGLSGAWEAAVYWARTRHENKRLVCVRYLYGC